jgi:hypothetical protein
LRQQLAEEEVKKQAAEKKAKVMDVEAAKTDKTRGFKFKGWLKNCAN